MLRIATLAHGLWLAVCPLMLTTADGHPVVLDPDHRADVAPARLMHGLIRVARARPSRRRLPGLIVESDSTLASRVPPARAYGWSRAAVAVLPLTGGAAEVTRALASKI